MNPHQHHWSTAAPLKRDNLGESSSECPSHKTSAARESVGPAEGFHAEHPAFHNPHDPSLPSGYYTQISTLADTQENVMEYLHVLSRPMVINHDHDIIWTEAYMDSKVRS